MNRLEIEYRSPEWLKFRQTGIGGSDASSIFGLNPYKSNVELWEEKTGIKEPKQVSNNESAEYGLKAEEYLLKLFQLDFPDYEVSAPKDTVYQNGFMFASLDGEIKDKKTGEMGILEIKTTSILSSMHREKWNDKIPDNYYIQILHYLAVTGYSFAILKAQLKYTDGEFPYLKTIHRIIKREEVKDDIEFLISEEKKFWQCVVDKKRPPLKLNL